MNRKLSVFIFVFRKNPRKIVKFSKQTKIQNLLVVFVFVQNKQIEFRVRDRYR